MRKIIILLSLIFSYFSASAQFPRISFESAQITTDINGGTISKNDTVDVKIMYNPNGNTTVRSLYFDFQHQGSAFDLIDVIMVPSTTQNSALPQGATVSRDWYEYPGYSWVSTQQNNTTNGNINYSYSQYSYTQGGPSQITRVYANVASNTPLQNGVFMILRFKMLNTQAGYSYDPLVMNFVAAYTNNGTIGGTEMVAPRSTQFVIDPIANSLVTATLELNSSLIGNNKPKVLFLEVDQNGTPSTSSLSYLFDVASDNKVNINQSQLKTNQWYKVMAMLPMDSLIAIQDKAITISDYTAAQNEFVKQNLDGTFQNINLKTGASYLAADVNYNRVLDGADLTKLFAHVVTVDTLIQLPADYQMGSNGYMSVPTLTANQFNNLTTTDWKNLTNPSVLIKTTTENQNLDLKYLILGDVNRSHSSQVIQNGQVQVYAKMTTNGFVNSSNNIPNINVTLNNLTVTSNNIEIPFSVNTNTNKVNGIQFEVVYDAAKIKFEEIKSEVPNTWFVFANNKEGKLVFGALDKDNKTSITGSVIPFKLKFSTLQNGLDITTQIKVTKNMDASDNNGNQLGINLNTTTIKLTGYNKFN